jgi:hypothetical protein
MKKRLLIIQEDKALVPLGKNAKDGYAEIDLEDVALISNFNWLLGGDGYVSTTRPNEDGRWRRVLIHRVIMGTSDREVQVDHKNHDKKDNRRSNLRECDNVQNQRNTPARIGSSKYKGVWLDRNHNRRFPHRRNRWRYQINTGTKLIRGSAVDEVQAALEYNKLAEKHFGEFAVLNEGI